MTKEEIEKIKPIKEMSKEELIGLLDASLDEIALLNKTISINKSFNEVVKTPKEILKETYDELSSFNPSDWKSFEDIMEDGTGTAMIKAIERYHAQFSPQLNQVNNLLKNEVIEIKEAWEKSKYRAIQLELALLEARKFISENHHSDFWETKIGNKINNPIKNILYVESY